MKLSKAIIASALIVPSLGLACSYDVDCDAGSRCVTPQGQTSGICVGGHSPGNSNDKQPADSPLYPNRTTGNTCSFDTDCRPDGKCVKERGSIYGACVRPPPKPAEQK